MTKKLPIYGTKALTLTISDTSAGIAPDSSERTVKGLLSAFDVMDSDRDIIRRGAFAKSLAEHGVNSSSNRKIQFLRNHDWEQQIGKFLELYETEQGLEFVAQLGRSTKGNDAFLDYQDGIIKEHSIGFNYIPNKMTMVNDTDGMAEGGGYWEIFEVKLWEGSAVTFGANEFTPVLDVSKSADTDKIISDLAKESEAIAKALKTGKGTDERLHSLEMRLRVLSQKYQSLLENKPTLKETLEKEQKPTQSEKPKPEQGSGKDFLLQLLSK